jgi:REP element-mobilizing transposase RayT
VFFADGDYAQYRDWLIAAAEANALKVHAWVLMPNHVHLLVVPHEEQSLPRTMQTLGRRCVRFVNARLGRPKIGVRVRKAAAAEIPHASRWPLMQWSPLRHAAHALFDALNSGSE